MRQLLNSRFARVVCLSLAIFAASTSAFAATLTVQNLTLRHVLYSQGYMAGDAFILEGWFPLPPGQTRMISSTNQATAIYAKFVDNQRDVIFDDRPNHVGVAPAHMGLFNVRYFNGAQGMEVWLDRQFLETYNWNSMVQMGFFNANYNEYTNDVFLTIQ